MTIAQAIEYGAGILTASSIPSPQGESSLLLRYVLRCDAAFIYAHPDHRLNAMESILYKAVIKRRSVHEPYQYIVGTQEFYGLEFDVTPDVLIPRPETEILVEGVISEFANRGLFRFCEVGIGSGCIAVSLLANLPQARAVGIDISEAALAVASKNAIRHEVDGRLDLFTSDVFESIKDDDFDLIVSNPPYVPEGDVASLQQEVKRFEPHLALSGGSDGLHIVRQLISSAPNHLKTAGLMFIEIGWDQSQRVVEMFEPGLWAHVEILPDLQGIPRIVKARSK